MSDTSIPQPPREPSAPPPEPQDQPAQTTPATPSSLDETATSTAQTASPYPYTDQQGYQQGYQQNYQQDYQQNYQQNYQQTMPPTSIPDAQQAPPGTQQQTYQYTPDPQGQMYPGAKPTRYRKERLVAGILALTLGAFGAHKFYLGYTTEAVIMLLLMLVGWCLLIGPFVAGVIALIEGILYLLKSDEEFERTYVYDKKGWF